MHRPLIAAGLRLGVAAALALAAGLSQARDFRAADIHPTDYPTVEGMRYDPASFPRTSSHAAKRLCSLVTGARYPFAE